MTDLIDTTEMYLRTIFELEEEGVPVLRARIAERLAHTGPTVSQTVARMERDGLLAVRSDRSIELSDEGRVRATRVMRKHRLAERLLLDVIGLEYEDVHAEACRWEHVMSERVERKIITLLSTHAISPYGNPIPGLDELDVIDPVASVPVPAALTDLVPVAQADSLVQLVIERFGEPLQADRQLLARLYEAGIVAGAVVGATVIAGRYRLEPVLPSAVRQVSLDPVEASHVFVRSC